MPQDSPDADRQYPQDVLFHPAHDWFRPGDGAGAAGITWYAQDKLGEIVYFDPPEVGDEVVADEPYAEVESVKAVSDVVAPVTGRIVEVNAALESEPEAINRDPYGAGWLVKIHPDGPGGTMEELLDAAAYRRLVEEE